TCANTATTKTHTSFVDYANEAGDQTVIVPNGTYKGLGTATHSRGATSGPCKGWLVLKAQTQGGVTIDLSGSDTGLTLQSGRIMFIGFKFIKGSVHASASDVTFWYDDMSFFQTTHASNSPDARTAEMQSYGYSRPRVVYPEAARTRVLGSELHNACSIIRV